MQKVFHTLLLWTLILAACSTGGFSPEVAPPAPVTDTPSPIITTDASTFEGCAYVWAYQDLPTLSGDFQESIQQLQAEAKANAFAFGENCVRADGSADFIPMETDFNITLQVIDLSAL